MGFFKKRGKPRQYKIEIGTNGYSRFYELYVWDHSFRCWDYLHLHWHATPLALEHLRAEAALDAKIRGYGDNYVITELI